MDAKALVTIADLAHVAAQQLTTQGHLMIHAAATSVDGKCMIIQPILVGTVGI